MTIRRTSQGYEVSDIIDGYLVHKHYIGYTKKEAVAKFKQEYLRRNPTKRYLLEPKYFNATVWSYDVWGNARDGWEVNNRFKFGTWKVMEGVLDTNKGVLQFLKQINFLKKGTQLRSLSFDGDDRLIIVDAAKDGYPLCSIELD